MNANCFALTADPFKNAEKGNYRLKGDSGLIDRIKPDKTAGETIESLLAGLGYAVDLDGQPRILGKGLDIGCYEAPPTAFFIILR